MRFLPLALSFLVVFSNNSVKSEQPDFFSDKIENISARFLALNVPDLEKIQIPQVQSDGSFIFIYIWIPKTHRPTTASFEANVADYFDVIGAQSRVFSGWCLLRKPEMHIQKSDNSEVAVMRIWALAFYEPPPRGRCRGGHPGKAGQLGQTQIIRDPGSGLLSMVRSGHPTRFPLAEGRVQ